MSKRGKVLVAGVVAARATVVVAPTVSAEELSGRVVAV